LAACAGPVRIFSDGTFGILERELSFELSFEGGHCTDKFGAGLLEGYFWGYRAVRLDFDEKVWV
jgi:hypothetical protein